MKNFLLGLSFLIGLLLMVPLFLWGYFTLVKTIDTVTQGNAYGFVIGENKQLSYQRINNLVSRQQIKGFDFARNLEQSTLAHQPQKVAQVAALFHRWETWIVYSDSAQSSRIDFHFENNQLATINVIEKGKVVRLEQWPQIQADTSNSVVLNMAYSQVYAMLIKLEQHYPDLTIHAATSSRRILPKRMTLKEYGLVADLDIWHLRVSERFFSNSITLTFNQDDKLIKVHRNRIAFELP